MDMAQMTGWKLRKECNKASYSHPDYLTYMKRITCEMLHWMNHKLESRFMCLITGAGKD